MFSPSECPDLEDPLRADRFGVEIKELSLRSAHSDLGETFLVTILTSEGESLVEGNEERVVVLVGADPVIVDGTRLPEGLERVSRHGGKVAIVGYCPVGAMVGLLFSRGARRHDACSLECVPSRPWCTWTCGCLWPHFSDFEGLKSSRDRTT